MDYGALPGKAVNEVTRGLSLRSWFNIFGGAIGLFGIIFVSLRLENYSADISFLHFSPWGWVAILIFSVVYGAANILLARAWFHLLLFCGSRADWRWALKVYGRSQLGKYIPGNIFHLAGRQALGMAAGLPARPLVSSAAWEIGLIALAGSVIGVLATPLLWSSLNPWMLFVLLWVALFCSFLYLRHRFPLSLLIAFCGHMAFLAISGVLFVAVLSLIAPDAAILFILPAVCGAYVVAWLVGLITPGAPAGVGVREAVILFLLGAVIAQADLLLAVVLGRIVTVLGDLGFFLAVSISRQDKSARGSPRA